MQKKLSSKYLTLSQNKNILRESFLIMNQVNYPGYAYSFLIKTGVNTNAIL